MDLTSERVLFGAAGAGGIQSYAQNLQIYNQSYSNYVTFDYHPATKRTALVRYYGQNGSNYPAVTVWDENWTNLFRQYYYNGSLGSWGFSTCKFDESGNLFITGSATQTNYNTPLLKLDTNYNLTVNNGGYYFTTSYGWSLACDSTSVYIASSQSTDGPLVLTKTNLTGSSISWNKYVTSFFNSSWGYSPRKLVLKNGFLYTFVQSRRQDVTSNSAGIIKWDTNGSFYFASYAGTSNAEFSGGYVDNSSNIYCAGWLSYYGTVVKLDSNGTFQWGRQFSTQYRYFYDVTVDETTGDVYASGLSQKSGRDGILIVKFNSSGTIQWQRRFIMYSLTNNSYTLGMSNARVTFQPNGALRVYANAYDYTHGFTMTNIIEYDPVTIPTGNYTDPFSYGGYVNYRWEIDSPSETFSNIGNPMSTDNLSISNASNSLRSLLSHSTGLETANKYGFTSF